MFTTLAEGLGTLPAYLAKASGAAVRTGSVVRELSPAGKGWRLTVGSAAAAERIEADAVILALPARPAGRLLAGVPGASAAVAAFGEVDYASMAIVTLAYPRSAFPGEGPRGGLAGLGRSGYLVPAVDGRAVKAVTFSTVKWPHLAAGAHPVEVVRCSVGRVGEEALLHRADDDLAGLAAAELAEATGVRGAPVATRVTRWGGALPQYTVGHLDRVARIRASVAAQPGLAVCGAAYDGVGIPACVATARTAVSQVIAFLGAGGQVGGRRGRQWWHGRRTRRRARRARSRGNRKPKARDLNELIRYTMWSVFRVADRGALEAGGAGEAASEVADLLDQAAGKGVVTRGCYDVQGLRADADFMFWWIASSPDDLQDQYARFRRTRLGRCSEPVWSAMALHRPAEFNKGHIPAFLADEEPRGYVSVYPFVRSYQWYLLDPAERRRLLAEHGMMAREYPDVRANTVACFSLNDYEWILAFEADELHRIVDLMRHLRGCRGPAAHPGGDPVLHRPPQAGSRVGREPGIEV